MWHRASNLSLLHPLWSFWWKKFGYHLSRGNGKPSNSEGEGLMQSVSIRNYYRYFEKIIPLEIYYDNLPHILFHFYLIDLTLPVQILPDYFKKSNLNAVVLRNYRIKWFNCNEKQIQYVIHNKCCRTVASSTQISIFTSSRGNEGCQKMNNLSLHILTPQSLKSIDKCLIYGHFNACGSSFKNDTWAYININWI